MSGVPVTSTDCDQVMPAFAAAVADIHAVAKGSEVDVDTYKFTFASLGAVLAEVRRVCSKHGLAVSQIPGQNSTEHGDFATLATLIVHTESGQWLTFEALAMKTPGDPQKVGGVITYARRYALTSIFSIPTEDDDANGATKGMRDEAAEFAERTAEATRVYGLFAGLDDAGKEALRRLGNDHERGFKVPDLMDDAWRQTVTDLLAELG